MIITILVVLFFFSLKKWFSYFGKEKCVGLKHSLEFYWFKKYRIVKTVAIELICSSCVYNRPPPSPGLN